MNGGSKQTNIHYFGHFGHFLGLFTARKKKIFTNQKRRSIKNHNHGMLTSTKLWLVSDKQMKGQNNGRMHRKAGKDT